MTTENATISALPAVPSMDELRQLFRGKIIVDGDVDFEQERKIWNGMIDRRPAMIAQCLDTADIQAAVKFARKNNLLVSVRGGGHNISGNAVCDAGIMIDISKMKAVKVDADKLQAVVEMGATWGDFDKAAQEYGLATTGGIITTTGVAGLTLGGGVGWLVRKHGLSCDNLIEAKVVTAEGHIVTASVTENPDLLWGLRGGSGNFGIVSSMTMRLHKVNTVVGGMILHTRDKAVDVFKFYRDFVKTAPNDLTLYVGLLTSPDGIPVVALIGCYSGDLEKAEDTLAPVRNFGTPIADLMQPMPYVQMQALLDGGFPHGNRYYWKSGFLNEVKDEAIELLVNEMAAVPSPYSASILEYYGGASMVEPEGGAAYPHREAQFDLVIGANWLDKADDEANIGWARKAWAAMQPFTNHRVYVNALGVEGEDRVREAYGQNYQRLLELKKKYDPTNFFRMNQNINPDNS